MRKRVFVWIIASAMAYGCSRSTGPVGPGSGGAADYPVVLPPDTIENVYAFVGLMTKSTYDSRHVHFSAVMYIDSINFAFFFDTLIINDSVFVSVPYFGSRFPVDYTPGEIYRFELIAHSHDSSNDMRHRLIFYEKAPDVDSFYVDAPDSAYSTETVTIELNLRGTPHIREVFWIWVFDGSGYYCGEFRLPSTATEFTYDLSRCAGQSQDAEFVDFLVYYVSTHHFPSLRHQDYYVSSFFLLGLTDEARIFLKDRTR